MTVTRTILTTSDLTAGYISKKEEKTILSGLNLNLNKGDLTCLLGPNGSGKSTLIRTLTSIQKPLTGTVEIAGKPLIQYSQKELARNISLVLTDRSAPGNLTGYALVSLGRFPYTSWMGTLSESDKELIYQAMESTGTIPFANRHIGELSDGERQKIMIARALVQDTEMIFLDEPTAHLDLPNRIEIFHLLQELAHKSDKAILLSTHEMDMALSSADQLWLVTNDNGIQSGLPEDLVLSGELERAFTRESLEFDYETGGFRRKSIEDLRPVAISGPEILKRWTPSALEGKGLREKK
ncbi:MAG: ABC transporter ATP-binding protein, partial [Roseivirga sp.]|nr:ABC transporter ATP-binding protein [Roseivirga sp.]